MFITHRFQTALINGTEYKQGLIILLGMEEDVPQFGKLGEIVLTPSKEFFFITLRLITLQYRHHYHAYEVNVTDEILICSYQDLYDYHPLELTVACGGCTNQMVSLKYHVF